jgi:hypothetical protein
MAMDFRSQIFEGMALIPTYASWLLDCDMEPAYRYHQRVLKLLQWHCPPRRWWLKTPSHMASIRALDAVYPDARFVMTHRDIAAVIPSLCALKHALSGPLLGHLDLQALGRFETEVWSEALRRLVDFRDDAQNETRFFDVAFAEVQRNPLTAVRELYSALGEALTIESQDAMERWWSDNSGNRSMGPRPRPEEFGLDQQALRREFAFYHRRFGIPLES